MLVKDSFTIRKSYDLTAAQAQALVDLEAVCADLGLKMAIACKVCNAAHLPWECTGHTEHHEDGTTTFRVKCECTDRAYRGVLVVPSPPRPLRDRRVDLSVKPTVPISRAHMKVFEDAATCLHQLKLIYGMRCLACQMEDRDSDGVRGNSETNAMQFVLECDCTRRVGSRV